MSATVDLDKLADAVIVFTSGGKRYAYTRETLLTALGIKEAPDRMNQASLGKALSWIAKDVESGKLADQLELRNRLGIALNAFDGRVSGHPTRIGSLLARIAATHVGKHNADLIASFLQRYPTFITSPQPDPKLVSQLQEIMTKNLSDAVTGKQKRRKQ